MNSFEIINLNFSFKYTFVIMINKDQIDRVTTSTNGKDKYSPEATAIFSTSSSKTAASALHLSFPLVDY